MRIGPKCGFSTNSQLLNVSNFFDPDFIILNLEMTSSPFETETLVEVGYQTFPKQKHTKVMQEKGSTSRNSVQICQVDYIETD